VRRGAQAVDRVARALLLAWYTRLRIQ